MGQRYVWNKYNRNSKTTYSERTRSSSASFKTSVPGSFTGYTGCSFNSNNGTFSLSGATSVTVYNQTAQNLGTHYRKSGSSVLYGNWTAQMDNDDINNGKTTISCSGTEHYAVSSTSYIKGSLIGPVSAAKNGKYPNNNYSGSYWYVYQGADSIDPAVSIPESVMGGDTIQITLTPSEGKVYGGNVSYLYEYKVDDGEWTAIATTAETTQSLLVPKGTNTVQVRVRAQDDMGFVSEDYVLSAAVSVINNLPPTAPGSIQATNVIQDEEATITLTAASDPDGQVVSYIYERSHDDGEWEQIADVNSLTCTDRVGEWAVVAYRAKAVDNEGASGPYAATETQDVNVNYVYIGGPGEELGPKPAPFPLELLVNVSGTSRVTDISVRAALDGKSIYTGTPDGGETIALEIDTRLLGAGEHTVEVQASKDDYLPASKRYTFNVPAVVLPDGGVGALAQDPAGRAVFHTTLAQRCIGRDGVDIQAQMDALAARVKTLEG